MAGAFDDKPCRQCGNQFVAYWRTLCRACWVEARVYAFSQCERLNREPITAGDIARERRRLEEISR